MKRLLTTVCAIAVIAFAPGAASAQSSSDPAISLVHGIPGVTVDIVVDGSVVIDDVEFDTIVDISSFAGQTLTDLEVVDVATDTAVIGPIASIAVPGTGNWSIVAYLDASGNPTLGQFENNITELDDDTARVTVRHTAETGPVDIIVGTQRPITNLTNGSSTELVLPSGQLAGAQLAPTGFDPIGGGIPTLNLEHNTNSIVYAVGSPEDGTLGFVIQVVQLPETVETTTTTTDPNATTTTSTTDPNATTTTSTTTTSTTVAAPTAVNTGSPIDGNGTTWVLLAAAGGLVLAGVSVLARRRV